MRKRRHLAGLFVIAIFLVFSAISFQSSLTPYVTFAQAKSASGSVQVKGVLVSPYISPMDGGKGIDFLLRDEAGEEVRVTYLGAKPDNIEEATSIVAIGKYRGSQFAAEKLLVKCPSKYQNAQGSVKK